MAVLNMRPHTLSYLSVTEGFRDENGDYHKGGKEWVCNYIRCDAVPAGEESVIKYEDGTEAHYSYVVYTDKNCKEFQREDVIRIAFFDGSEREFSVKGFHRYQHQCKIWV